MKRLKILYGFELEINKLDDNVNKPNTDDSLYWLNLAVYKFVKERFNGNAPHFTSYELNEKRTKDLLRLRKTANLKVNDGVLRNSYDIYRATWPNDVLYVLNEEVTIDSNGDKYETSVFECTSDNYMYRITNSLTDFHYRHGKARPLRVRDQENTHGGCAGEQDILLLTDKNYSIDSYIISYIRRPQMLDSSNPDTDPEYNDFDDSVWFEIIKIAALMYVENQSEPRYRTLTNEVLTQE